MSDFLTLTEFRATGSDATADELEAAAGTELSGAPGRIYKFATYIERMPAPAKPGEEWCLTVMNDSWAGPLHTLEALLYSFVRTEVIAHLADDAEYRALVEEWEEFCVAEKLEAVSADEMSLEKLTAPQRSYVRQFIERWEVMTMRQAGRAIRESPPDLTMREAATDPNETLRLALIAWLSWNDRNGCYGDLTLEGALQLVLDQKPWQ